MLLRLFKVEKLRTCMPKAGCELRVSGLLNRDRLRVEVEVKVEEESVGSEYPKAIRLGCQPQFVRFVNLFRIIVFCFNGYLFKYV